MRRLVRLEKDSGMVPEKPFLDNRNSSKLVNDPMVAGKDPWSTLLPDKSKYVRFMSVPITEGKVIKK